MNYKAFVQHNRELAMTKWSSITLSFDKVANLSNRDDANQDIEDSYIRGLNLLESWCKRNVRGDHQILPDITGLVARFEKRSEAVRFKLTWGGDVSS